MADEQRPADEPRPAPRYGELAPAEDQGAPVSGRSPEAPEAPGPSRPRPAGAPNGAPQYGELAPEGWSWSPETGSAGSTGASGTEAPSGASGGGRSPLPEPARAAESPQSGKLPGVPHNLGVGADPAARPADDARPATREQPQVYRATEPPRGGEAPRGGKLADRIATIALLALGAYGALSFALGLQQFPQQLRLTASMLGIESVAIPDSIGVVGTVGAIAVLAIYAVNLIFSIQRMRARKLAFWVPLAAFGLALIVVFACSVFAVMQLPELVQQMSDPDALSRLLGTAGSLQ